MQNKFLSIVEKSEIRNNHIKLLSGNIVSINLVYKETGKDRIVNFKGIILSVRNKGINSSFIVRKIFHGEGIELTLQLNSPIIKDIQIENNLKKVRKAKLFYFRKLKSKALKLKSK